MDVARVSGSGGPPGGGACCRRSTCPWRRRPGWPGMALRAAMGVDKKAIGGRGALRAVRSAGAIGVAGRGSGSGIAGGLGKVVLTMSSVNEWVVREYLEALGFLVRQPRKYQVVARSKGLHEEVDLLAVNPAVGARPALPEEMLWGAARTGAGGLRGRGRPRLAFREVHGGHAGEFAGGLSLRGTGLHSGRVEPNWGWRIRRRSCAWRICRRIPTRAPRRSIS